MKIVGFLDVHAPTCSCSISLEKMLAEKGTRNYYDSTILEFLANGHPLIKLISPIYDIDGSLIGPVIIYTDGEWIWPSYYIHYLRKYKFNIPLELALSIRQPVEKVILDKSVIGYCEYMVSILFDIKLDRKNIPTDVRHLVELRGEIFQCF